MTIIKLTTQNNYKMRPQELLETIYKASYCERRTIFSLLNAPRNIDPPDYSKPVHSFGTLEEYVRTLLQQHFSEPDDKKAVYIQERRVYASLINPKYRPTTSKDINDQLFDVEYTIFKTEKNYN